MSVRRTHKSSELEKKLHIIERQLYGKSQKLDVRGGKIENEAGSLKLETLQPNIQTSNIQHPISKSEVAFLKQDLVKILVLSGLAFAIEIGLYLSNLYSKIKFF